MTLNGYFALNSVVAPVWLAETVQLSKNNCVKTNKDRNTLSTVQIFVSDSSFWQGFCIKVCADIRSGSLDRRLQRTVGSCVKAHLEHLFLAFKNNYVKVNTDTIAAVM